MRSKSAVDAIRATVVTDASVWQADIHLWRTDKNGVREEDNTDAFKH